MNKTVVFCNICGTYLGKDRPYFAKEHLKQFPSHTEYLVKTLIDPLILPNPDRWFRYRRDVSTEILHAEESTEDETEPTKDGFKYYIDSLLYRRIRKCQPKK